ncbi:MAG: AI-2E family transporter, partial [candidate division KSB1 bacterium]
MPMTNSAREYTLRLSDRQLVPLGRVAWTALFVLLTVLSFYFLRHLITPVVISVFLAYLLEPLVNALENRGIKRLWGTITVLLGFCALFGTGIGLLREQMAHEIEIILANVQLDQPELLVDQAKEKLKASFPEQGRIIDMFSGVALHYVKSILGAGVTGMTEVLSAFGATIIIPFLIFFILNDSHALQKAVVQQIPNRYFEMSLSLIHKANEQLGRYIRGVLLDAAIVGAMVVIALLLLDLRYAVFIGILAGMANLIPYLGPVVGGIPAIVISVIDQGNFNGVPSILLA